MKSCSNRLLSCTSIIPDLDLVRVDRRRSSFSSRTLEALQRSFPSHGISTDAEAAATAAAAAAHATGHFCSLSKKNEFDADCHSQAVCL